MQRVPLTVIVPGVKLGELLTTQLNNRQTLVQEDTNGAVIIEDGNQLLVLQALVKHAKHEAYRVQIAVGRYFGTSLMGIVQNVAALGQLNDTLVRVGARADTAW